MGLTGSRRCTCLWWCVWTALWLVRCFPELPGKCFRSCLVVRLLVQAQRYRRMRRTTGSRERFASSLCSWAVPLFGLWGHVHTYTIHLEGWRSNHRTMPPANISSRHLLLSTFGPAPPSPTTLLQDKVKATHRHEMTWQDLDTRYIATVPR